MERKHAIGFALTLVGLPIVWVLRGMFGISGDGAAFSYVFMAAAVALLVRWTSLLRLRLYGPSTPLLWPIGFIVPSLLLGASAGAIEDWMYLAFLLVVILGFYTVPMRAWRDLPYMLLMVSFVACGLTLFDAMIGGVDLSGQRLYAGDSGSPNQLSFVGGIAVVTALYLLKSRWALRGFKFYYVMASLPIGLIVILLSGTRSTIVGLALSALGYSVYWVFSVGQGEGSKSIKRRSLLTLPRLLIGLTIGYLLSVFLLPENVLLGYLDTLIDFLQRGYQAYFYGQAVEESAEIRHRLLLYAFSHLTVGGEGFKALYVDFPLLQAFYDLGIIGGSLFLFVSVAVPAAFFKTILFSKKKYTIDLYGALIYLLFFPNLFVHGQPYDFSIWLPIILFYGVTIRSFVASKLSQRKYGKCETKLQWAN